MADESEIDTFEVINGMAVDIAVGNIEAQIIDYNSQEILLQGTIFALGQQNPPQS